MNTNALPIEVYVILGGIGVIVAAWLLLRFGKIIGRALLVAGVLVAIIVGLLALLTQAGANRQTAQAAIEAAEAAKTASAGQSLTAVFSTLCIGGLGAAFLAALGGAGYLWVQLQLAQHTQLGKPRRQALRKGGWRPGPNALWGRDDEQPSLYRSGYGTLPTPAQQFPAIYLVETEPEPAEADFQGWEFEDYWGGV